MKRTFEIQPSVSECAEEFAKWSGDEQANFFMHVDRLFSEWGEYRREKQILYVKERLSTKGLQFVEDLARPWEEEK